jgi:hypothetical protein
MSSSNFRNTNSQNTVFEKKNPNLNNSNVIGHHGAGILTLCMYGPSLFFHGWNVLVIYCWAVLLYLYLSFFVC